MASEMSTDMKFSEEEVVSHPRILEGGGGGFGSMNMDEFMSNIWNVEEFQAAIGVGLVGMEEAPLVGASGSGGGRDAG
ncbi:unnamed protein product [Triticum turgidum subsp. durum]|uniref:Uncharacterized protein n=1 Tax=Triticum turgidum subsp. durum TaxID=4567 RepID=A0A9R1S690_TRITD|nr:unnamed protein product [Triticum turgidum subsp. durum]